MADSAAARRARLRLDAPPAPIDLSRLSIALFPIEVALQQVGRGERVLGSNRRCGIRHRRREALVECCHRHRQSALELADEVVRAPGLRRPHRAG